MTLLSALGLSACNGWNSVEHGEYDVLTFTPDDCGRASCDLDDPIAVGGTFRVTLDAVDNGSVFGLTLISSNPYIMDVRPIDSFSEEYEVYGNGAGWADLIAIDGAGYEIDYITIRVAHPQRLSLDPTSGRAERAGITAGREVWRLTAGELVTFDVEASSSGVEMMGRLVLDVYLDQLFLDAMTADARLTEGHLSFQVPAGTYDITFIAPSGMALDLRFIAE